METLPSSKEDFRNFKSVKKRIRLEVIKEYKTSEKERLKKIRGEVGKTSA